MTRLEWDKAKRLGRPSSRPSEAQLRLLADLGVTVPPATRAEASQIIRRLKNKGRPQ